jgi:inosine-uridine nucleoside N-ribohydrolase
MVCETTPVVIDTDPGCDDVIALLNCLASQSLDIKAITLTFGNVNLRKATRNLVSMFHAITLDKEYHLKRNPNYTDRFQWNSTPVIALGSEAPLKIPHIDAEYFHGLDGIGNLSVSHPHYVDWEWYKKFGLKPLEEEVKFELKEENKFNDNTKEEIHPRFEVSKRDAVDEMLHQIKSVPPFTMTIIALGPLTNVAKAIERDPLTMGQIKELVIMGGAVTTRGNVTHHAEFNFYGDPHAAKIVMDASAGYNPEEPRVSTTTALPLPVTLVPLDVTESARLFVEVIDEKIQNDQSPIGKFLYNMLKYPISLIEANDNDVCEGGMGLHDPLCVGFVSGLADIESAEYFNINIVEEGEAVGKCTVDDPNTGNNVKVILKVKNPLKFQHLLLDNIMMEKL